MKETQQFAQFAATLLLESQAGSNLPAEVLEDAYAIWQTAHSIQRLAEVECNRSLTDRETKRQARLEQAIHSFGKKWHVLFQIDGDPRGYVVKLRTPKSERYNTWGGRETGWGIGA